MASDEHGGGGIGAGRGEVDAAAPLDAIKIRGRIHHHLRTCSAAVKKARAFEVQKTVKKLKGATDEERGGLESLLQALKGSNHAQIAAIAIKSKFVKARLLPRATMTDGEDVHQQYPLMAHIDELEAYLKSGEGSSSVNVDAEKARAKLLSNKVVSEEVSKMVKVTSALLRGEEPTKQDKAGDKTERRDRRETVSVNEKTTRAKRQRETDLSSDQEGASASTSEAETVLDAVSDNDDEGSILRTTGGQEAKPVSVGKLSLSADFSKRKSDTDERDGQRPSKQLRKDTQSHDGDESDGEEESAEGLLPALSTGFVGGRGFNLGRNSEDEWSDGDADLESIDEDVEGDANRKEARKNRMGQRARRAIWEKKFGKGANHLKLLEKDKKQRTPLRPPPARRPGQEGLPSRDSGWSGTLGGKPSSKRAAVPALSKAMPAKAEVEMHPSWIAKQKQKEKEEAAARNRSAAKKIVFD